MKGSLTPEPILFTTLLGWISSIICLAGRISPWKQCLQPHGYSQNCTHTKSDHNAQSRFFKTTHVGKIFILGIAWIDFFNIYLTGQLKRSTFPCALVNLNTADYVGFCDIIKWNKNHFHIEGTEISHSRKTQVTNRYSRRWESTVSVRKYILSYIKYLQFPISC